MQQKILLLGANGQLGREWQHFYSDEMPGKKYILIPFTSARFDITNRNQVINTVKECEPDFIINCAAYTKVDEAENEREKALQINATAVKNIANICAEKEIKLIHYSTDYVFAGKKSDQKRFPEGYPEDHAADPVNWYGKTKWEGEQAIRESGCEHLILRLSWLCGAYGGNFVTTMLRLAENSDQLKVVDDQLGSPTFTANVVKNSLKLIDQRQEGTFHLTTSGLINWAEFASTIFEIRGIDVAVEPIPSSEFPTEAKRPQFSKLNTSKVEKVDGVKIEDWKIELKDLLQSTDLSSGL